jgi:hypothetical protein
MNNETHSTDSVETINQQDLARTVEAAIAIDQAFEIVDKVLARDPHVQGLRAALSQMPIRRALRMVREAASEATEPGAH